MGPWLLAAITTCRCEITPERLQLVKGARQSRNGTRLRTKPRRLNPAAGFTYAPEGAPGFAVCKLRCGHAVQERSDRAYRELLKRADAAAIEAAWRNNGRVDRMYSPELLRVEAAECRRGAIGKSARVERTLLALAERLESQATILEGQGSAPEITRHLPKSWPDR
jgi:hypothetical protein